VIDESAIRQRLEALAPVLDERGRRRFAAAEATSAGHGGILTCGEMELRRNRWDAAKTAVDEALRLAAHRSHSSKYRIAPSCTAIASANSARCRLLHGWQFRLPGLDRFQRPPFQLDRVVMWRGGEVDTIFGFEKELMRCNGL
jgi:hypothetical protein